MPVLEDPNAVMELPEWFDQKKVFKYVTWKLKAEEKNSLNSVCFMSTFFAHKYISRVNQQSRHEKISYQLGSKVDQWIEN